MSLQLQLINMGEGMFVESAKALDLGFLAKNQHAGSAAGLNTLANRVINTLLFVAGALAIIYIIYSGILYITAAGNPDNAKKGQQGLLNGAIGLVVIVLAYYMATAIAKYASTNLVNP